MLFLDEHGIFVSAAFFLVTDSHPTSSCGVPIDATNRITFRRFLVPSRLSSLEASKLLLLFLAFHFCHPKFFCFSGVRVLGERSVLCCCGTWLSSYATASQWSNKHSILHFDVSSKQYIILDETIKRRFCRLPWSDRWWWCQRSLRPYCNICPLCDISLCALLLIYFEPSKQVYTNFLCPIVLSKLWPFKPWHLELLTLEL